MKNKQIKYVVVHSFKDLQDGNRIYKKGNVFNSKDKTIERIAELSTKKNKIGKVLIKEQE